MPEGESIETRVGRIDERTQCLPALAKEVHELLGQVRVRCPAHQKETDALVKRVNGLSGRLWALLVAVFLALIGLVKGWIGD